MKEFSFKTIENFDAHIEASVPNYAHIHELILSMSTYFLSPDSVANDLGCSSGLLIDKLDRYQNDKSITYNGFELEKHIIEERYFRGNKMVIIGDVTKKELPKNSLTLSIFLLQFLSKEKRLPLLKNVYNSLEDGGALIITEKTYEESGLMQEIFTFSYYDLKLKAFTAQEILEKQKTLRKIQKPLTAKENEKMFREVGFNPHQFYQSLGFRGWICLK